MKLKKFRMCYIIILSLLTLFGVFLIVSTMILFSKKFYSNTDSIILNIFSYGVGIVFTVFEAYMVIKSFRHGTLLLRQISFKNQNEKRKATGIISLALSIITLCLIVFVILLRTNVLSFSNKEYYLTYEFLIYYLSIVFVNALITLTYYCFLQFDDVSSFK